MPSRPPRGPELYVLSAADFDNAGRSAVVTEDPQRLAGPGVSQPPVGVEQEALHRRMQERVEQARPGAADVVGSAISSQETAAGPRRAGDGGRAAAASLHPGLVLRTARAGHRDDQAPGPACGQVVDPRGSRGLAPRRASRPSGPTDRRPARPADPPGPGWPQALDQRRSVTSRPSCGPGRCTGIGALGGGIPDAVRGLQQRREPQFPVRQLGDLGEAVEQAPARS